MNLPGLQLFISQQILASKTHGILQVVFSGISDGYPNMTIENSHLKMYVSSIENGAFPV